MTQAGDDSEILRRWGLRLKSARLERNDSMAEFAGLLGVSEATVRAMERGLPTVEVGTWLAALSLLTALEPLGKVLEQQDRLLVEGRTVRERAGRQKRHAMPTG